MKSYLLAATGVIFVSVIVSLIVPEGKLHKTATFVMRLICIAVLIQPVTSIFGIESTSSGVVDFDSAYVCEVYSGHQSEELSKLIKEEFGEETECTVDVEYEEGEFSVAGVMVATEKDDGKLIEEIYAYLENLGYINITVYAKGA